MSDPTEMVITGGFALAALMFVMATALRGWRRPGSLGMPPVGDFRSDGTSSYAPSGNSPQQQPEAHAGKVPVWLYQQVDLLGAALVFAVFSGLVFVSLRHGSEAKPALDPGALVVSIGFQFLMAGMVTVMVAKRTDFVSWLGLRWKEWPWVALIAPGAVVFMWLVFGGLQYSGYVEWMESLGVETVQDTVKLLQESKDPLVLGLMAFAAVIAAPLCEEIVFRGYLYPVMKKFGGIRVATLSSALVFAAAHGNLTAMLPLFIFGCVLVFLYEKTGSLWAPIASHFCFNGATVLVQMAVRYYEIPIELPQ